MKNTRWIAIAAVIGLAASSNALTITGTSVGAWDASSVVEESADTYVAIRNADLETAGDNGERARIRFGYKKTANQPKPDPQYRRNGLLYEGAGSNLDPPDDGAGDTDNDIPAWETMDAGGIVQVATMHYYDNINGQKNGTGITYVELDLDVNAPTASGSFTYGFDIDPIDGKIHETSWTLLTPDSFTFDFGGYRYEFELLGFSLKANTSAFNPGTDLITSYAAPDNDDTPSNDDLFLYGSVGRVRALSVPDAGATVALLGAALLALAAHRAGHSRT